MMLKGRVIIKGGKYLIRQEKPGNSIKGSDIPNTRVRKKRMGANSSCLIDGQVAG